MSHASNRTLCRILFMLGVLTCALLATGWAQEDELPPNNWFFNDVRVFDGTTFVSAADVIVRNGVIVDVGPDLVRPPACEEVDGQGHTLLPGLIDCHVHTFFEGHLDQAAIFGVTTECDMMSVPRMMAMMRARSGEGNSQRADIFSAGAAVTVKNGHGTQFGFPVPTLDSARNADAFVKARVNEGSDYIKIIYDDGKAFGINFPTLSVEMLQESIKAAHKYEKMAVAHIGARVGAQAAIAAGIDGLVHMFADLPLTEELIELFVEREVFVVPTCAVITGAMGDSTAETLISDPHVAPLLTGENVANLRRSFPVRPNATGSWAILRDNLLRLHEAGVVILAGTDAPNPATVHGASIHHEMGLLVECGLTPAEAMAAATSLPAKCFGFEDRGQIANGKLADLILVHGDPTDDITVTRNIVNVWKRGELIDRDKRRAAVARQQKRETVAEGDESRMISDFEDAQLTSTFGTGWTTSTDAIMGGDSTAELKIVDGGAQQTKHAMKVQGRIREQQPAFAGAMFTPGKGVMQSTDISAHGLISFWVQGEDRDYAVMLFFQKRGFQPSIKTIHAGPKWTNYRFKINDFDGCDGTDVLGIWFGSRQAGEFSLNVDEVELTN